MAGLFSGILGGVSGALGAIGTNNAITKALPNPISLGPYTDAFKDYGAQGGSLGAVGNLLGSAATQDNDRYLAQLEQSFPGITDAIKQQSAQALAYQQGAVNPDQQRKIALQNAYKALQGGYARSGLADSQKELATARTALGNVDTGNALATQAAGLSASLSPETVDVSKTLLSPQDLLQRDDALAYHNNDIFNQQKAIGAGIGLQNMNAVGGGIARGLGGIGSLLSGGQNGQTGGWNSLWGNSGLGGFFASPGQGGGSSVPGGFAGSFGNLFG